MANRPGEGKCVHCLTDAKERDWDHVFPASWCPDSAPPNLEKWRIPSCIPCNRKYGKLENDFLTKVGLCLDPFDPASRSIVQTALRSMKPAAARNSRDAKHRLNRRRKILAEALHGDHIPQHGTYPGLGDRWPELIGDRIAVLVPVESFRLITEKIVRGIFYIEEQKFIEPPNKIGYFALAEEDAVFLEQLLNKFGTVYAREPGIVVRRAVAPEDGISSLFSIEFWKQFKTYASVTPDRQPSHAEINPRSV
jgi:hypothetical protein